MGVGLEHLVLANVGLDAVFNVVFFFELLLFRPVLLVLILHPLLIILLVYVIQHLRLSLLILQLEPLHVRQQLLYLRVNLRIFFPLRRGHAALVKFR